VELMVIFGFRATVSLLALDPPHAASATAPTTASFKVVEARTTQDRIRSPPDSGVHLTQRVQRWRNRSTVLLASPLKATSGVK
jgi:hypothetical protein